ncbi:DUF5671 domain-containing protein [Candidatus Villigracilis saccharophilus]|uniref:DUF5671 domain-containing protein n=1 Tax=Candidatus Villigracilis saccharophilus TaxID=3140684 RepID=UPI00313479F5|nr:hypothetical protein [Anaerolineales bacterium]
MKTIRRLYFYAVAFISFEVVLWGLIGLIRSIINPDLVTNNAQALAQALSLILVGVPIFLIHWLWAQRTSAREEEEKNATLRAVFLYGALLATLIPVVQNLLALINRAFLGVVRISYERALLGGTQSWPDNLIAITLNLLLAAYFWSILRADWSTLTDTENFKDIRRLYRFLWVLYGLLMVIFGAQQILRYIFYIPTGVIGMMGRETFINATALLIIGAPIWSIAWRILQDALADPDEKESLLRLGILYLLSLSGVIVVLTSGGNLFYILLNRLFGEQMVSSDFIQKIGGPISLGLPFGVMWAYYGNWLNQQIGFEPQLPRRAGMMRIYFYILSLLGLIAAFIGLASLFSFLIDFGAVDSSLNSSGVRQALTSALAILAVGLPLWLKSWRPLQTDALTEGDVGDHARRSIIRKVYLYLVLFASVIGAMVSAGTLIFTLINALLGGDAPGFINSILNSLQTLILFVILLTYHLSALRKDGAVRADALEARQEQFGLLVFDHMNGKFGESVKAAFMKHALKVQITVVNLNEKIPDDMHPNAVVLSGSVAVNTPENVEVWMRSFNGSRLIVADDAAGVYWLNDLGQAAESVRILAEGQKLPPQSAARNTSVWTTVAYVFAALFALQLVFILITLGISLVTGF